MKKSMVLLVVGFFLAAMVPVALAATIECTVKTVENRQVILDCGTKAKKVQNWKRVKIREAIDGC